MSRPITWIFSALPLLKISQIICFLLVIVFFIDGRQQWMAYQFIFLMSFIFVVGNIITLAIHFFDISRDAKGIPWISLELLYNVLGALTCLAASAVLAWDWMQIRQGRTRHHSKGAPINIGNEAWNRRVLISTIVLAITAFFYLWTIYRIRRAGLN